MSLRLPILILLLAPFSFAQTPNQDSPLTMLASGWQRSRQASKRAEAKTVGPIGMMSPDDKNFQRTAREQQPMRTIDTAEYSVDKRSSALEKNVKEAQGVKSDDSTGYTYFAKVRNDNPRTIEVVFWEYRFVELANPSNVVRRQFLCAAKIKPGEKRELSAFSILGPSDVISAESLAKMGGKPFDETVLVNRIEYADGGTIHRRDWKYEDVRPAVERAISTAWGKEVCRAF